MPGSKGAIHPQLERQVNPKEKRFDSIIEMGDFKKPKQRTRMPRR